MLKDFRKTRNRKLATELKAHTTKHDYTHCHYCKTELSHENRTLDHIIPKCNGGKDDLSNLVFCCQSCNQLRDNIPYEVFINIVTSEEERKDFKEAMHQCNIRKHDVINHWSDHFVLMCGDKNRAKRERVIYELSVLEKEFQKVENMYKVTTNKQFKDGVLDIALEYFYSMERKKQFLKTLD